MSLSLLRKSSAMSVLATTILALTLSVAFTGCKGAQKKSDESGAGSISEQDINQEMADSDSGRAAGMETIHYDYDSSTLSGEAKSTLDKNAAILKEKSNLKVQVEGHTDERGGIQYNIALGERRAKAAKHYLVDRGVSADRISVISYGKEKPVDAGHDESAWNKNRRANFRITEK